MSDATQVGPYMRGAGKETTTFRTFPATRSSAVCSCVRAWHRRTTRPDRTAMFKCYEEDWEKEARTKKLVIHEFRLL